MTEEKFNKISLKVRETVINFLDVDKYELLDLVVSLHNELCNEVEGKYCDYAYHWANLGYGGEPNDSLFKDYTDKEVCCKCAFVCGLKSHADGAEPRIYCEMWHEMVCSNGECEAFKARGGENE